MKQVFTFLAAVLLTASVFAQSPEKMSYQAVIRNNSDQLVMNQTVGMQISILHGSTNGTAVYVETQTPTSNANGLISIEIREGIVVNGNFTTVDWANGPYFIKTETDPAGGTTYTITGTSQLLSVPYALHAKTAETISGGITESDPVFVASPANGIASGDITNWNSAYGWGNHATAGYLTSYTETDPLWTASPSYGITNTNISNWNSAYGWGNHATAGYLTSYTETDPLWTASPSYGITNTNITNWNSAYGWGNHATAGYLTSYIETDPLWTASPSYGITNTNITNWNSAYGWGNHANAGYLTSVDGSETKLSAGTNVTITGNGTTASPYVVNATGATTLTIGQSYQGGIIFWLDATGQHGLIAATADQSTGIQWYNGTHRYTGTTGDGLYAGAMNTTMIVATQMADNQTGNFAAKVCADYSVTVSGVTYGDWYLPSKYELNLLYLQKTAVGGFASAYYWSSTEGDNNNAWLQDIDFGIQDNNGKNYPLYVRAVRAF